MTREKDQFQKHNLHIVQGSIRGGISGVGKELSIFYQNVRGLGTKAVNFSENLLTENYDIVVITESWLNDSISSSELFDSRCVDSEK